MTIHEEIQEAISHAWATSDPVAKRRQEELIGDSHIPTPEELIFSIIAKIFAENT